MPSRIVATRACPFRQSLSAGAAAALLVSVAALAPAIVPAHAEEAEAPSLSADIIAVVNGDVVSRADVDNRRKLFALSTGLPMTPEVLQRLSPQVTRLLIDERLRLQEVQRRKIVVSDKDIAEAIAQVERQNNMTPGTLRNRLATDGVEMRTLIDQIRVQLGWSRVLRAQLADHALITVLLRAGGSATGVTRRIAALTAKGARAGLEPRVVNDGSWRQLGRQLHVPGTLHDAVQAARRTRALFTALARGSVA